MKLRVSNVASTWDGYSVMDKRQLRHIELTVGGIAVVVALILVFVAATVGVAGIGVAFAAVMATIGYLWLGMRSTR